MERFSDLNSAYYYHNRGNSPYCTHLRYCVTLERLTIKVSPCRLLIPAALMSRQDIIELGSGLCSTELLHQITRDKTEAGDRVRLVSVDTDKAWLDTFLPLQTEHHKLILVSQDWTLRPHLPWRDGGAVTSIYAH